MPRLKDAYRFIARSHNAAFDQRAFSGRIWNGIYVLPIPIEILEHLEHGTETGRHKSLLDRTAGLDLYERTPEADMIAREEMEEEPPEHVSLAPKSLATVLSKLNEFDADLLYMRYTLRKAERDIGAILDMSQAAISNAIDRAILRLSWYVEQETYFTPEELEAAILKMTLDRRWTKKPTPKTIAKMLATVWRVTSQSRVAEEFKIPQCKLRYWLHRVTLREIPIWAESDPATWERFRIGWIRYWTFGRTLAPMKSQWRGPEGAKRRKAYGVQMRAFHARKKAQLSGR